MKRYALFCPGGFYRYSLGRVWGDDGSGLLHFVGLNPSTADHEVDDATMRREIDFAKSWGFGGLVKSNLFAMKSTDPKALYSAEDPVGPENDYHIIKGTEISNQTIICWGTHGDFMGRGKRVLELLRPIGGNVFHLGLNKNGTPKHTLYLPKTAMRTQWIFPTPLERTP